MNVTRLNARSPRSLAAGLATFALASLIVGPLTAQQPAPDAQPTTSIMQTPEWDQTRRAFEEWLSVQQIYTPEQVQRGVRQLQARVLSMSESERVEFLRDMQEKLAVLNSHEAQQARLWLIQMNSALNERKREELREQLPDVANMSPSQLRQSLMTAQQRVAGQNQAAATAAEFRHMQTQRAMQINQEQQDAFNAARLRQQEAVAGQATERVQQGFETSMDNARYKSFYGPGSYSPLWPSRLYGPDLYYPYGPGLATW